jgi:1-acyl-sn-glycerol-3-phosphate acyltransferase
MNEPSNTIPYPRRVFIRSLLKGSGRLLISCLFKVSVSGKENLPANGPLIVVGNHTAVMEAVLLNIYTPWHIEMLGAADIPHERISQFFSDLYGFIPVNRGNVDRPALRMALSVLNQNGVLGIFPEGGIWEPGLMRAQTGVAWLSYRGNAPVLPIGFSGTYGSLETALKLKRPVLTMQIGKVIPPLERKPNLPRKTLFEDFSENVMVEVRKLILQTDPSIQQKIKDEVFELSLEVREKDKTVPIPLDKAITHKESLVKFFHRPAILKLFYANLNLPVEALCNIDQIEDPSTISSAVGIILQYLETENPYLLVYRFGPKIGDEMKLGLEQLLGLSKWASRNGWTISFIPIRRFFSLLEGKEIIQTKPGKFENWM